MRQADPRVMMGSQGSQEEGTVYVRGLGQERLLNEDRCRASEGGQSDTRWDGEITEEVTHHWITLYP